MHNSEEYWDSYYRDARNPGPSQFALFCRYFLNPGDRLVDCGCGDGRDSKWFASEGISVVVFDRSVEAIKSLHGIPGMECHVARLDEFRFHEATAVYARWVLHSVSEEVASSFICNAKQDLKPGGLLMLECRSDWDLAAMDQQRNADHYRRFVNAYDLRRSLFGMDIVHFGESRGWSKVGDDDPLLIRAIARKQ